MPEGLIQVHPSHPLVLPDKGEADIDVEMIPLIHQLWAMELATAGCCIDLGESILGNQHLATEPGHDRRRHGNFYWRQAWLRMPIADAQQLVALLGQHPVFGHRLRRWTHPEAWMVVGHIFPTGEGGSEFNDTAQISFPRHQVPELVETLSALSPEKEQEAS